MISMLHQSGRIGYGRPEHSGTSGIKNRLIKSGAAMGGGRIKDNTIRDKTTKAQAGGEADKKEKTVKKRKKVGGRTGIVRKEHKSEPYDSAIQRLYAAS
jgi:hypothetical protein